MEPSLQILIEHMSDRMNRIENKVDETNSKLDDLSKFRWKITGIGIAVLAILTSIFELTKLIISK